jgi:hypothetical protein
MLREDGPNELANFRSRHDVPAQSLAATVTLNAAHKYESKILKRSFNVVTESNFGCVTSCTLSHNETVPSIKFVLVLLQKMY